MKRIALIVVGLALVFPGLAGAQPEANRPVATPAQKVDFDAHDVLGTTTGPDGVVIVPKPEVFFRNLIQLRADFRPELLDSLHEL